MKSTTLTRQELYDLVWSTPMTTLVKKYGIADTRLRKICSEMDIPLPKAGHWEKVRVGKELEITELSTNYNGKQEITLIPDVENPELVPPIKKLIQEIEDNPELSLEVPDKLTNPDPLILLTKEKLSGKDRAKNGHKNGLSINVSSVNAARALRFMDAFIKLIKARGHKILLEKGATYVKIEDEKLAIHLHEKMATLSNSGDKRLAKTILCLGSYFDYREKKEWKDGKRPIEEKLAGILAFMEIKAKELKEEKIRLEKGWARQKELKRLREEIELQRERELSDFKLLLQKAKRYQEAKLIKEYLMEIENKDTSPEMAQWIDWARKKVNWYDPMIEANDPILNDIDRDSLSLKTKWNPFSI